jgi:D-lactate dehydrogenase (cytochrome)
MADGRAVRLGGRARKSAAGYDLKGLLIGSEGTLGVITELGLRLCAIPEAISAAVCTFPSVEAAVAAVIETIQLGIPVARIELLDAVQMRACMAFSKLEGMIAAPTLFYEFHGTSAGVAEQAELAGEVAEQHGGGRFAWATHAEERNKLWQARHDAYYAALALRPGGRALVTDVCVPISSLAACISATQEDIQAAGLVAPILGHVGDGNFHLVMVLDPDDPAEWKRAETVNGRMVERALAMGGTCTGEHGIGLGKMQSLVREQGDAVGLMAAIRHALDPGNIMNPGKIFVMPEAR